MSIAQRAQSRTTQSSASPDAHQSPRRTQTKTTMMEFREDHGIARAHLSENQRATLHKTWMCTYARNEHSGKLKMHRYDLTYLVKFGAFVSAGVKGTIFTMDSAVARTLAVQLVVASAAGVPASFDEDATIDSVAGLVVLSHFLGKLVPFVLALFISMNMVRWWQLRTEALDPLFKSLTNVCLCASTLAPDARYTQAREQILRYGLACTNLMIKAARGVDSLEGMVTEGILMEDEASAIANHDLFQRAMVMWAWILRICYMVWDDAHLDAPSLSEIVKEAMESRDAIEKIHIFQDTQLTFAYVHLITLLVNMNDFVVSMRCGVSIGLHLRDIGNDDVTGSTLGDLCTEIVTWALVPIIYHGLLGLSYVIHDPFGEDVLDLPIAAYMDYTMNSCRAVEFAAYSPAEALLFGNQEKTNEASSPPKVPATTPLQSEARDPEGYPNAFAKAPSPDVDFVQRATDALGTQLASSVKAQTQRLLDDLTQQIKASLARTSIPEVAAPQATMPP